MLGHYTVNEPPGSSAAIDEIPAHRPVSHQLVKGAIWLLDMVIVVLPAVILFYGYDLDTMAVEARYFGLVGLTLILTGIIFFVARCYDDNAIFTEDFPIQRVIAAWFSVVAILLFIGFGLRVSDQYSRVWAVGWTGSAMFLLVAARVGVRVAIKRLAAASLLAKPSVIVGAGEAGRKLAQHFRTVTDHRFRIVGFIDDRRTRIPSVIEDYRVIGTTKDLVRMVREGKAEVVFISLPWSAAERIREIMEALRVVPVDVRLAPDLVGYQFTEHKNSTIAGLSMPHVSDRPISGWSQFIKSAEDRLLALAALTVLAPLMALVAIAIKLDSKGPVIFRQPRYGFNNQLIEVWKFRSMYTDLADRDCEVQTTKDDPRITRIGKFLRRSSLDELPQIFNVLFGTMSFVGPRPHAVSTKAEGRLFEEIVDQYAARHNVKPGITGWAQVNGWRGETDTAEKIQKRVEFDLFYIENWSLALDVWILLRTLRVFIADPNAY